MEHNIVPIGKRLGEVEARVTNVEKDIISINGRLNKGTFLSRKASRSTRFSNKIITDCSPNNSVSMEEEQEPDVTEPVVAPGTPRPVWNSLNTWIVSQKGLLNKSSYSTELRNSVFKRNHYKTGKAKTICTGDGRDALADALNKATDAAIHLYKYKIGTDSPTKKDERIALLKETLKVCDKLISEFI